LDDEAIEFDEEIDSEIEIELEIDLVAQELINAYAYCLDREKKIKYIEVRKIVSTSSYQKAQMCVRKVIIKELDKITNSRIDISKWKIYP